MKPVISEGVIQEKRKHNLPFKIKMKFGLTHDTETQ